MFKRFVSLICSLVLALAMVPAAAFAAPAAALDAAAADVTAVDGGQSSGLRYSTATYENPLYGGKGLTVTYDGPAIQAATSTTNGAEGVVPAYADVTASALTKSQAAAVVRTALRDCDTSEVTFCMVDSGYDSPWDALDEVMAAAFAETSNPFEGDYMRWNYAGSSYSCYYNNDGVAFRLQFNFHTTYTKEKYVRSRVASLVNGFDLDGKTNYEKVSIIYNWITSHVTYDYDHLGDSSYDLQYTAYAALKNGTSVCQGYATLLYAMCETAGVNTRIVTGCNHSWNIVKMDNGYYYNVDATWDAGSSPSDYYYFLQSDEGMGYGHSRDDGTRSDGYLIDYTSAAFYKKYPMGSKKYVPSTKKTQPVSVTVNAPYTVYSSTTTKTAATNPLTVTGNKSTLTYTLVSAKNSAGTDVTSKFSVGATKGALKVKAGTKAGTYTLKVKVSAPSTSTYLSYSKTSTVTVTVKKASKVITPSATSIAKTYTAATSGTYKGKLSYDRTYTLKATVASGSVALSASTLKYTLVSAVNDSTGAASTKFSVSSTGTLTTAKGLAKGRYTVKIKVSSAATANYKAATSKYVYIHVLVS